MPDTAVRYVIVVDSKDAVRGTNEFNAANKNMGDVAIASYSRAQKSSDSFAAQMIANNKNIIASNQQASLSHSMLADRIRVVGEAATTTAAILVGGIKVFATYAASTQSATLTLNGLVNTVRAAEVTYSAFTTGLASASTITTASSIGLAILAEETVRYTLHTAKLIEQRSILAAQTGVDIGQINELALASTLAGKSNEFYLNTVSALQKGINSSAGRSALGNLGIYGVDRESPELLARIGVAFEKIQDPAQRAKIGIALFGSEFEKVQQSLNSRFGTSIELVREFGAALGPEQATNIDLAKRNLEGLGRTLEGTFDPARLNIQRLKHDIADFTASIINSPFANPDSVQARKDHPNASSLGIGKYIEDARDFRIADELVTPVGNALIASRNAETAASNPFFVDVARKVFDLREERSKSREGVEAFMASAKERYSGALAALAKDEKDRQTGGHGTLTFPQRQDYNVQAVEARKEIVSGQSQIARLDAVKAAADSAVENAKTVAAAQKSAAEFRKHALEAEYTGLARVDVIERETLAQYGTSPKARQDIGVGVAALREKAQRESDQEQRNFYQVEFHDRAEHRSAIIDNAGLFTFQATQFDYKQKTEDQQRAASESAALFGVNEAGFSRDAQLRALDKIDAQTVKAKQDLEQKKADIENDYLVKSLAIRSDAIERANNKEIDDLKVLLDSNRITRDTFDQRRSAIVRTSGEQGRQLSAETQALIEKSQSDARIRSEQIERDSQLQQFNSIKSGATDLIDTLFTHTRDLGQAIGSFFKHAVLGPLEEIAASQVAKLIFGALNPSTSISFASGGGGSGALGKYGGFLSHFGFGSQPIIAKRGGGVGTFDILAGSDVGDRPAGSPTASLLGGGGGIPFFGGAGNIAAQLPALLGLNFAGDTAPAEQIGAGRDTSGLPVLPSGLIDRTASDFSGATAPSAPSYAQPAGSGFNVGGLTGLLSRFSPLAAITAGSGLALSGIFSSRQTVGSSASTVSGLGLLLGGAGAKYGAALGIGSTGGAIVGAEAGVGAGLLLDGARRRSPIGALESIGGGALAGAAIGSIVPGIGTAIGAGIGAGVGAAASLLAILIPTDRAAMKDQVKALYHLSINNQIADQLIQMAKQSYGGSFSVAIRSKPAQDLLSLFAQATGQNALFGNVPHPAYLTESGGQITQQASYIGGQAYSFGGALGVTNGIPTATIPNYVAGQQTIRAGGVTYGGLPSTGANGTIQLDAEATRALLTGQAADYVAGNPRAIADANANAQQSSYDRRSSAARLLSPGLITGYA